MVWASPLETKSGAKITKNEAEHIALKQHPGARVTAAKLETVQKVKIWSIEIAQGEQRQMVLVDAMSGQHHPAQDRSSLGHFRLTILPQTRAR